MSSDFLQTIGVDVDSMEAADYSTSSSLPRLNARLRSSSAGSIGMRNSRSSEAVLDGRATLRHGCGSSGKALSGSRPGSRSSSTGSTGGPRRRPAGVQNQPATWQLGRLSAELQKSQLCLQKTQVATQQAPAGFALSPPSKFNILRKPANSADMLLHGIPAVLFLDVDGVLHPTTIRFSRQQFAKSCMQLLREVVAESQATIVLSTAWREDPEARQCVADKLSEYGLPPFVSQTPSIARYRRTKEIMAWVRKYRPVTWVAVDDLPLLQESSEMQDHFVQTHAAYGLRPNTAKDILRLFDLQRRRIGQLEKEDDAASPLSGSDLAASCRTAKSPL